MNGISADMSILNIEIFVEALNKLLQPDYTLFNANLISEIVKSGIELIPVVGPISGYVMEVLDIINYNKTMFKNAKDYSSYLENYILSATLWDESVTGYINLTNESLKHSGETGQL